LGEGGSSGEEEENREAGEGIRPRAWVIAIRPG
jgi:hypothetical protein